MKAKRIRKKVNKALLSLMLAATMVVEPVAGSVVTYAAEPVNEQTVDFVDDSIEKEEMGQAVSGEGQNDSDEKASDETGDEQDTADNSSEKENGFDESGPSETGDEQDGTDESSSEENGSDENVSDGAGDVQDGTDGSDTEENGSDENVSDETENEQNDIDENDSDESASEEDREINGDSEEETIGEDSEKEADLEDSEKEEPEEEIIEDEDNWQGTGHKAPSLEMELTSAMVAEKKALDGTAERLTHLEKNVQYSANQAVFLASSKSYANNVAKGYGATLDSFEDGVAVITFSDDVADIIAMAEDEKVKLPAVYPNYIYTTCVDEMIVLSEENGLASIDAYSDPFLNSTSAGYQYYHSEIHSLEAWNYNNTAGSGIKVAVIDSGINKNHVDLKNRVASASVTFSTPYNKAEDNDGHGTHVSGIIAANKDNDTGGAGIAYKASIVSIKALEENPITETASGDTADLIKAVNAAVNSGARVINMSLGGQFYDALYESVVTNAVNKGVVVVVAAGNANVQMSKDPDSENFYSPSCFADVITVSAKARGSASRAGFSNYGAGIVDITAPGEEIASSYLKINNDDTYIMMSGTSQASPMVAAAAAYILSVSPDLVSNKTRESVENVKKILQDSAVKTGYSDSAQFGAGLLNVEAAIKMAAPSSENGGTGELKEPEVTIRGQKVQANETIQDTDEITLSAAVGNTSSDEIKIYYTTDGKNPTEKSTCYTEPFRLETSGNKTIKAMAVYYGKKSKVTTLKVKVNAYVTGFNVASKTNSTCLGSGKSMNMVVSDITPSYATNKKVKWEIVEGASAAKINESSGKLTANADITAKTIIKVRATAADNGGIFKEILITLLPKVTALTLTSPTLEAGSKQYVLKYETAPETVQMKVEVSPAEVEVKEVVSYTSSNMKVVTVDSAGLITAVGNGTATITAKTTDGSNKKVTLKVKVTKLVQDLEVTSKTGELQVAAGKSLQMVADITSDATNKKVKWELEGTAAKINENTGKLTAEPKTKITSVSMVKVKATALDESKKSAEVTVTIYPTITGTIGLEEGTSCSLGTIAKGTLTTSLQLHPYTDTSESGFYGRQKNSGDIDLNKFTYTSSNNKIATVSSTGLVTVNEEGKTGTAKIKVVAKDGSGKSVTCNVKVVKPVTSISIYPKNGVYVVGKGKTLTLGAIVNSDASSKKIEWSTSDTSIATVSNGKVKGVGYKSDDSDATVTIYAKATDGSGVSALCTVKVRPLIKKLAFYVDYYIGSVYTGRSGYETSCNGTMYLNTPDYLSYWMPYYFDEVSGDKTPRTYLYDGERYAYWDSWEGTNFSCSNSNVIQIVTVPIDENTYTYCIYPVNKGTATITYKALDGSGKSCKMKITVK